MATCIEGRAPNYRMQQMKANTTYCLMQNTKHSGDKGHPLLLGHPQPVGTDETSCCTLRMPQWLCAVNTNRIAPRFPTCATVLSTPPAKHHAFPSVAALPCFPICGCSALPSHAQRIPASLLLTPPHEHTGDPGQHKHYGIHNFKQGNVSHLVLSRRI